MYKDLLFLIKKIKKNKYKNPNISYTASLFKKGKNFYSRNLHHTLYYNPIDLTLNIFYKSIIDVSEEIVIMINKEKVITVQTKPYHWHTKPLGIFNDINHVKIYNSEKVIYEKTFDSEFRKIFKTESYISSEEDN